ncbi:MAG: hypothetical protein R3C05_00400 [Pirellulaceae bacterium]
MLLESVEFVWIVWLVSVTILLFVSRFAIQKMRWRSVAEFVRDEEGASYAIPFVLTLPFLLLIFCCALQGTLVLLVKFGTVHAAFASARAAVVWQGADPRVRGNLNDGSDKKVEFYADRAAVMAMTPFASGVQEHYERVRFTSFPTSGGFNAMTFGSRYYDRTYERLAGQVTSGSNVSPIIKAGEEDRLASESYVYRKLRFAATMTKASVSNNRARYNAPVEVSVTYRMPLHIPMAGAIFDNGWGYARHRLYTRRITTTVTLPSEMAQTVHGRLEIPYFPDEV